MIFGVQRGKLHYCSVGGKGVRQNGGKGALRMVPNTDGAAALMRACFELPCTLRGNAPPRRSVDTCASSANATDLVDVVVSAGKALRSGTAVGEVVSPSWTRGCTADVADVPAVVTTDIAAAAAASTMGAAVVAAVAAMGVAAVAA